jgi:hypothetical protein
MARLVLPEAVNCVSAGRRIGVCEESTSSLFPLLLANNIDPPSNPYAGGGAIVPWIGANPHFFTFASTKTKPTNEQLVQGLPCFGLRCIVLFTHLTQINVDLTRSICAYGREQVPVKIRVCVFELSSVSSEKNCSGTVSISNPYNITFAKW